MLLLLVHVMVVGVVGVVLHFVVSWFVSEALKTGVVLVVSLSDVKPDSDPGTNTKLSCLVTSVAAPPHAHTLADYFWFLWRHSWHN
jgi:hypothetical protein